MFTRRVVLKGLSAVALATALPFSLGCDSDEPVPPPSDPVFGYGVASGDPLPNAVILWTKIIAEATVSVRWEIAKDATFASVVGGGAVDATSDRDFTVKVDATGLEPGTTYFYRFLALGTSSPIGRTRTAPADARDLRFAVVSCASLPHGYFHVYRTLAERPDLDAIIHLGDYIYEYAEGDYGTIRESEPKTALTTLADYRERYAQYRRDRDLQEAHRQHPFICIWDDHEFIDNAWRDGTTGDNGDGEPWADRKQAATRAYAEYIPMRDETTPGKVWRSLRYGSRAELFLLDTRVWGRDVQLPDAAPGLVDSARQILGKDQEQWLRSGLESSTAQWKLVCQQVMMTAVPNWFRDDGWDDYPAARARFYDILEQGSIDDVVVLSGDVHSSWASDLARDPVTSYDPATGAGSLAVEFITPAVTSPGNETRDSAELAAAGAWLKYIDLVRRGFILLDVTETQARAAWFHVADVESQDSGAATFTKGFATNRGENRLHEELAAPAVLATAPPLAPAPVG